MGVKSTKLPMTLKDAQDILGNVAANILFGNNDASGVAIAPFNGHTYLFLRSLQEEACVWMVALPSYVSVPNVVDAIDGLSILSQMIKYHHFSLQPDLTKAALELLAQKTAGING